jgi:opacity protein-like surface antigen
MKKFERELSANKEAKMRYLKSAFLWLCLMSILFAPILLRAEGSRVCLRLWGGMNYLLAKDVNDGNRGRNDLISSAAEFSGWSVLGETNPIRMGYDFGGDLIINLTPGIGLGFGAGYIQGTKESQIAYAKGTYNLTMTSKPDIRAIPLRAGLFLNLPMGERVRLNFNVGAGYYISKYSYDWKIEGTGYWDDIDKITYKVSVNGIGFHGGVGLEFDLTSNLAFFIEGQARYAKIGSFEGTVEKHYKEDWTYSGEGNLYCYDLKYGDNNFKQLDVRSTQPSGPYVTNVREANVDFSGVYGVAGIKIKF